MAAPPKDYRKGPLIAAAYQVVGEYNYQIYTPQSELSASFLINSELSLDLRESHEEALDQQKFRANLLEAASDP